MLLVLSAIVLVIVLVLVIDFYPLDLINCNVFMAADNPNGRPKIDNEDEHENENDCRQKEEDWNAAKQSPWPQRGGGSRQRPEPANLPRDVRVVLVRRCVRCWVE